MCNCAKMNRIAIEISKVQELSPRILRRSPARFWRRGTRSPLNPAHDALLYSTHAIWSHTDDEIPSTFRSFRSKSNIASHSRPSALNRPSLTSPPLSRLQRWVGFYLRTGDQYGGYYEVRPHGSTKRSTAEVNEKLTRKKKIYRHTFKDTASASSRDRTLCLGPVVRHLYISHWSRVYIPLPPSVVTTTFFGHFEKRCTSLLFSYFSVSFLSLSLSLWNFLSFSPLWCYPLFRSLLLSLCYEAMKFHTGYSICFYSCQSRLIYSNSWMKEFIAWKRAWL